MRIGYGTLLASVLLAACSPSPAVKLNAMGELVTVITAHGSREGELITWQQNQLVILQDTLETIPAGELRTVKMLRDRNLWWVPVVLLNGFNGIFFTQYLGGIISGRGLINGFDDTH